jgi:hypothetical protein
MESQPKESVLLPINDAPLLDPLKISSRLTMPSPSQPLDDPDAPVTHVLMPGGTGYEGKLAPVRATAPTPAPEAGSTHTMGARHPLPYAFAKAHTCCWKKTASARAVGLARARRTPRSPRCCACTTSTRFEHEARHAGQRIAAAYAGGESSAAAVIGEVESGVDLSRMMQDLPAVEDLLEAADDAPIIRMLNALLTQAAKDGAATSTSSPTSAAAACAFASTARCARWCSPTRRCTRR